MSHKASIVAFASIILMTIADAQNTKETANGSCFGVSAGLGVTLIRTTDIVDYSNSISASGSRMDDFGVAAELFGASEIRVSELWGVKLEYSYLMKSNNITAQPGYPNTINYYVHMPTVLAQYLVFGKGYAFKFGGGLGYHMTTVNIPSVIVPSQSVDYTSKGIGIKLEAEGNTEFDEHFFGVITADIRSDIMGEVKDSHDNPLIIQNTGKHVSMNFLSLGLKFGMIYYF